MKKLTAILWLFALPAFAGNYASTTFTDVTLTGAASVGNISSMSVTPTSATSSTTLAARQGRVYYVEDFGAAGNNVTDDAAAFSAAISAAASNHGGIVQLLEKQYYVASSITIPQGVTLQGPVDPGATQPTWNQCNSRPWITLGSGATINVSGGLKNTVAWRVGVACNPANPQAVETNLATYSGTGVTVTGQATVDHVGVFGMAQAIYSSGPSNYTLTNIFGNDLAGILVNEQNDYAWIDRVNFNYPVGPASGGQFPTTAITNVQNDGGLIEITAPSNGLVTGDTVIVKGVGGINNANGRWPITVVDANDFTLNGSTFSGSYTSGGSVTLNTMSRPGPCYEVENSTATLAGSISCYGYDNGVVFTGSGAWNSIRDLNLDDYPAPDPGTTGIQITGTQLADHIHVNFISSMWTALVDNSTNSNVYDPNIIEGGDLYAQANTTSAVSTAGIQLLDGPVNLSNDNFINTLVQINAAARVHISNSQGTGATLVNGSSLANTTVSNSDLFGIKGANIGTFGAGALSPIAEGLVVNNVPSNDLNRGGEIEMINPGGGANPNKFFRVDSGGNLNILNNAYSRILNLSDAGALTLSTYTTAGVLTNDSTGQVNSTPTLGAAYGGLGAASLTGYLYGNGSGAATASTTIPSSAITGTFPNTSITGLGTAATQNIGTSGANIPLLNTANTWGAGQTWAQSGTTITNTFSRTDASMPPTNIGLIQATGNNSAGANYEWAGLKLTAYNTTAGSESGGVKLDTMHAGSINDTEVLTYNADTLSAPSGSVFDLVVSRSDSTLGNNSEVGDLFFKGNNASGMTEVQAELQGYESISTAGSEVGLLNINVNNANSLFTADTITPTQTTVKNQLDITGIAPTASVGTVDTATYGSTDNHFGITGLSSASTLTITFANQWTYSPVCEGGIAGAAASMASIVSKTSVTFTGSFTGTFLGECH